MIKNKMKKVLLFFGCMLLFAFYVNAQVPQGIPYQAVARNGQGQPLASANVKVRFSILDSTATGTAVYVESHSTTTSALGLFTANVGMGTASTGAFSSINWGQNYKFLKVELDTTATGNSYIDLGTQQMMSVPYALYSTYSNYSNNTIGLNGVSSSIHGHYSFSNIGVVSSWVVPNGITTVNILLSGSVGGPAGTASWPNWSIAGGAGGSCGFVNLLITVHAGDTLSYYLGNNGINGTNFYCPGGCCSDNLSCYGSDGEISWVKINSIDISKIYGGKGGWPYGRNNNCYNLSAVTGASGYFDNSNILDAGIFILSTSNDFNISCNQLIIRF
jgi:hypothetical protein